MYKCSGNKCKKKNFVVNLPTGIFVNGVGEVPDSGASSRGIIITGETQETFTYFQSLPFPALPSFTPRSGAGGGQEGLPSPEAGYPAIGLLLGSVLDQVPFQPRACRRL